MIQLNEDNIIEKLLEKVPEIKYIYEEEIEWWDDEVPGLHNIFGDVLVPFLINLLQEDKNKEVINRIFEFLECMAIAESKYIKNVLSVTVLESLGDTKEILKSSKKYMGCNTNELSKEIEKELGR